MRELNVDWTALHSAFQMNMPEVRCFLCAEDGKVIKLPPGDAALATAVADPRRFIPIEATPSRIQYQWLDEYIKSIEDEDLRGRMVAAVNGKGAFRRFKDILLTMPEERRKWFEFRDQMMRQRICAWVVEHGIRPLNPAPWQEGSDVAFVIPQGPSPVATVSGAYAVSPGLLHQNGAATLPSSKTRRNDPHDIEALRDFLIEWSDQHGLEQLKPLELDDLAHRIGELFQIQPNDEQLPEYARRIF